MQLSDWPRERNLGRFTTGLVLAAFFIVVIIVKAPASVLGRALPAERLQTEGFSGSLWRGSLRNVLLALDGQYLALGEAHWRLHPLSLLTLSPALTLNTQWGRQRIEGVVTLRGGGDFELQDFSAKIAASLLRHWSPLQVAGRLELLSPQLKIEDGTIVAGAGRLVWHNARFKVSGGQLPLGSYALDFKVSEEGLLSGEVITLAGPIEINGPVQLRGRRYEVDLQLQAGQTMPRELSRALQLVANPVAGGFRLKLGGDF